MIFSDRRLFLFAIGLAMMAGFVDALGFLSLHGVFMSFMSGNSTRFAVALTGESDGISYLSGVVIALFVTGVFLGTLLGWRGGAGRAAKILGFVALLLMLAAVLNDIGLFAAAVVCMTMAMGAENTAFGRNGEINTGLTYMTGTLVKIGQKVAMRVMGEPEKELGRYVALWLSLIAGAMLGTKMHHLWGMDSLWLAAAFAAVMAGAAWRLRDLFTRKQ